MLLLNVAIQHGRNNNVYHFGKPALFVTFTTNFHMQKMKRKLSESQNVTYCPDIGVRLFYMK